MSLVLGAGAVALLVLPALAWPVGRKLQPREWARVVTTCLVTGAVALELALLLLATPTVLRAVGVRELAAACARTVGNLAPGGPFVGWLAATVAIAVPVLVLRRTARVVHTRRGLRIEATLGTHERLPSYELVVLPTDRPMAMTVPGDPAQIVVSRGLVDALPDAALQAVLRHEETHAECRHDRYMLTALAVDAGLGRIPLVRRSTSVLRLSLERWADEQAATAVDAGRSDVHDALVRVGDALLAHPAIPAFSTEATLAERLDALDAPPPSPTLRQRTAVYCNAVAFSGVGAVGLGLWLAEARMMLAMPGFCRF